MLLNRDRGPLPARHHSERVVLRARYFPDLSGLVDEHSRKNHDAFRTRGSIHVVKHAVDQIGSQIRQNEIHRTRLDGIRRSNEELDASRIVTAQVSGSDLDGFRIDVAADGPPRSKLVRSYRENAGARPNIQNMRTGPEPGFQKLDAELRALVCAGSESASGIEMNDSARGVGELHPAWYDHEPGADRKTLERPLPLRRPVSIFYCADFQPRHAKTHGVEKPFHPQEGAIEIAIWWKEERKAGQRSNGHFVNSRTIPGQLPYRQLDQGIRDIDGELAPGR